MKCLRLVFALTSLTSLLFGCGPDGAYPVNETEAAAELSTAATAAPPTLYRGSLQVDGSTYFIDVVVTLDASTQEKECWRSNWSSGGIFEVIPVNRFGTIRTVLRDANLSVLGETTRTIERSKSIGFNLPAGQCTSTFTALADRTAFTKLGKLIIDTNVPGLVIPTSTGPIAVNRSVSQPMSSPLTLTGQASFKATSAAKLRWKTARGEAISFRGFVEGDFQNEIVLTVGHGADLILPTWGGAPTTSAKATRVVLTKQ